MPHPGDRAAYERRILPHADAAYNLARHLLRDDADARDAVQDALLRAWRYFDKCHGDNALPWLLQIVRNAAYSLIERKHPALPLPSQFADDLPDRANWGDPPAQLLARLDVEMVQAALGKLPILYREVLVLRELEGLSYKEIAAVTDASLGTIMSRISRARRLLQTALAPHSGSEIPHDL